MSKQIIVDYIPFEVTPQQINESISSNDGRLIVKGVLQRAEAKNQNGRIYPRDTLVREAKKYAQVQIKERRALGELDHPDTSVVELKNCSHLITEVWWEGNNVMGKLEVLNTPSGRTLKALAESACGIGISSRGLGSVRNKGKHVIVDDDFNLICFDVVSDPSAPGAFIRPVTGGYNKSPAMSISLGEQNKATSLHMLMNEVLRK